MTYLSTAQTVADNQGLQHPDTFSQLRPETASLSALKLKDNAANNRTEYMIPADSAAAGLTA